MEVGAIGVAEVVLEVVHASQAVSAGVVLVREVGATGVRDVVELVVHASQAVSAGVVVV